MSRLCLCLTGSTLKENREVCRRYADRIDLAELRADFLATGERTQLQSFPNELPVPCILTVRREVDGGCRAVFPAFDFPQIDRLAQMGAIIPGCAEEKNVIALCLEGDRRRLLPVVQ